MDKVFIEGLRVHAHVGVPEEERKQRQQLIIDVEMVLDLEPAGSSDQVAMTVDYSAVAAQVKRVSESGSFKLVEAVAEQVAQAILLGFNVTEVRVKVRKFSVPGASAVGVEITRGSRQKRSRSPRT